MLKNMLWSYLYFLLVIIVFTFLVTCFYYFNLLNHSVFSVIKFLIPVLTIFVFSFRLGKISQKNGYVTGMKYGGMVVASFLVVSLFMGNFMARSFIYYVILMLCSILASMIGINQKKAS